MAKNGKLTAKQAKFIEEYLVDMNASAAAARAGYSPKTAYSIGFTLLKNVVIQSALTHRRQELSAKSGVTPEKVIKTRAALAFYDISQCYDADGQLKNIHDIPVETRLAISSIDPDGKIRTYDRNKALEALEKHFGLYDADKSNKPDNPLLVLLQGIDGKGLPQPGD